jgi:hypothetical protein
MTWIRIRYPDPYPDPHGDFCQDPNPDSQNKPMRIRNTDRTVSVNSISLERHTYPKKTPHAIALSFAPFILQYQLIPIPNSPRIYLQHFFLVTIFLCSFPTRQYCTSGSPDLCPSSKEFTLEQLALVRPCAQSCS